MFIEISWLNHDKSYRALIEEVKAKKYFLVP